MASSNIQRQRASLPIAEYREQVVDHVRQHNPVIIVGETGSGKTTQISQYLYEAGFAKDGRIGITQPRRVAAVTVARRVAEEFGCRVGQEVGYTIRFEDCSSPTITKIKYMTDGVLLRECLSDPDLKAYTVIVLDEAHERSIFTDVLFGLLKQTIIRRKDLRLVVTSATLDVKKFSAYFNNCPVLELPGRCFPVDIYHSKTSMRLLDSEYSEVRQTRIPQLEAAIDTVMRIHVNEPPGHILFFLTGQEEIHKACRMIEERAESAAHGDRRYVVTDEDEHDAHGARASHHVMDLMVLPLYGDQPPELQAHVFDDAPPGCRKCIVGTNIAETSVTVEGIAYVVDPGFVKHKSYNPVTGIQTLHVSHISQVAAKQRAGRAGRTRAGKCFRLYSSYMYDKQMRSETVPEIQRSNLCNTVLTLKVLGIDDVLGFDFLDPPPREALVDALKRLYFIGVLDDDGNITPVGRTVAKFPLDPSLARVLLSARDKHCLHAVLSIVAMLSIQNIFYAANGPHAESSESAGWSDSGDHIALLRIYEAWVQGGQSEDWCREHGIQIKAIRFAHSVRKQLVDMIEAEGWNVSPSNKSSTNGEPASHPAKRSRSGGSMRDAGDRSGQRDGDQRQLEQQCLAAFCDGYFPQSARRSGYEGYLMAMPGPKQHTPIHIHPSSALATPVPDDDSEEIRESRRVRPDWVIYHDIVWTSKPFMRQVSVVEADWLQPLLPRLSTADERRLSGKHCTATSDVVQQADSTAADAQGTSQRRKNDESSVLAARERYLQRKRQGAT